MLHGNADKSTGEHTVNMEKIEDAVADAVREVVSDKMDCVRFNIHRLFGGLLFPVKLKCEKLGGVGDIDWLIDHVINTARYEGSEDEQYSSFDRRDPEFKLRMARVAEALKSFGVESIKDI